MLRETERQHACRELFEVLRPLLRLTEDETTRVEEALENFVTAYAEHAASQALDREFNRGDFRY
jgi:transposase